MGMRLFGLFDERNIASVAVLLMAYESMSVVLLD
jgi:hypothetical protein